MKFELAKSVEIIERIPDVLETLLINLSPEWTEHNEGPDTWSAYDVVGHMIQGEKIDWMDRMRIILDDSGDKKFKPFDRTAQFEASKGKTLNELLKEFKELRKKNVAALRAMKFKESDFDKTGIHPVFGTVTLRQLLSTWAAHDLGHVGQVVRVMAKQYKEEVGPWLEYLRVLKD